MNEPLDNLQAIGDQAKTRPANWFNALHIYAQRSKSRQRRFNKLALFTPRQQFDTKTGQPIPGGRISTLLHNDPADVEVVLERRDRYMEIRETIKALHKQLRAADDLEPKDLNSLMTRLRQLEIEGERQLKAIEEILWRSRDREHAVMTMLSKLISEGARLNQADRMHADRMSLERAMKPSNSELEEAEAEYALKHKTELGELVKMDKESDRKARAPNQPGTEVEFEDEGDDGEV